MKKLKYIFILIILGALGCILTACGVSGEQKLKNEGNVRVVFDCTGGKIDSDEQVITYILPESLLARPGEYSPLPAALREGYYENGWFTGTKNNDGTVDYGSEWDFSNDRVPEEGLTLYMRWEESYYIRYLFGDGFSEEKIRYIDRTNTGRDCSDLLNASVPGYHFLEGFRNAGMTQPETFPFNHPRVEKGYSIYVRTISDKYKLVKKADDISAISVTGDYYLMNDIVFDGRKWTVPPSYTGKFEGNGFTVSNINIDIAQDRLKPYYGLFGNLDGATVKDVYFKDCTVRIDIGISGTYGLYVGFLAGMMTNTTLNISVNPAKPAFSNCKVIIYTTKASLDNPGQFVTGRGKLCGRNGNGNKLNGNAFDPLEYDAGGIIIMEE